MALVEVPPPSRREVVTAALVDINERDGHLDPYRIVEEARDVAHPLHPFFEWDDTAAAEALRAIQAMGLIRSVRIKMVTVNDGKPKSIRGFLPASITGRDLPPYSYLSQDEIAADPVAKEHILRAMQRDISALERRYSDMAEFWMTIDEMAKAKRRSRKPRHNPPVGDTSE